MAGSKHCVSWLTLKEGLLGKALGMLQTPRKIWGARTCRVSWTIAITDCFMSPIRLCRPWQGIGWAGPSGGGRELSVAATRMSTVARACDHHDHGSASACEGKHVSSYSQVMQIHTKPGRNCTGQSLNTRNPTASSPPKGQSVSLYKDTSHI